MFLSSFLCLWLLVILDLLHALSDSPLNDLINILAQNIKIAGQTKGFSNVLSWFFIIFLR